MLSSVTIGCGTIRVVAVAIVMFLAIFYLKLGYFIILLLPLGAPVAVVLTRKQRAAYPPIRSALVASLGYCVATAVIWSAAIQRRDEMREVLWEVLQPHGRREPEVRLHLGGGHYVLSHSAELGSYLQSQSNRTVAVSLPVTRILGCLERVGPPRIEGWGVAPLGGYGVGGYGAGSGTGPWEEPWWCR